MFCKIVNNKTRATKTVEVDELEVLPGDLETIVVLKKGETETTVTFPRGTHTAYLMNEQGRTLDTYKL